MTPARALVMYGVLGLVLILPSLPVWFSQPFLLTPFEFDYFLGAFRTGDADFDRTAAYLGRAVHLLLFAGLGVVYVLFATRLAPAVTRFTSRQAILYTVPIVVVFTIALPWISPDVFIYIGTGWVESHYGLDPYARPIATIEGYASDEMFRNIVPTFLSWPAIYGPLFQKAASLLSHLSGGDVRAALGVHKLVNLGLLYACAFLIRDLSPTHRRSQVLFLFLANPLVLYNVMTAAHNDLYMLFPLLSSFSLVRRRRHTAGGIALGMAVGIKYIPLLFLPMVAWHIWTARGRTGRARALSLLLFATGFFAVFAGTLFVYPGSWANLLSILSSGSGVVRNSLFYLLTVSQHWGVQIDTNQAHTWGRVAFVVLYGAVLVRYVTRARSSSEESLPWVCLAALSAFFLIGNGSNHEWYLLWGLCLALLLPPALSARNYLVLSVGVMPLAIYTVRSHAAILLVANGLVYLLVAATSVSILVGFFRSNRRTIDG